SCWHLPGCDNGLHSGNSDGHIREPELHHHGPESWWVHHHHRLPGYGTASQLDRIWSGSCMSGSLDVNFEKKREWKVDVTHTRVEERTVMKKTLAHLAAVVLGLAGLTL